MYVSADARMRKENDDVFQEVLPGKASSPMEWRRSYKPVTFRLERARLSTRFTLCDRNYDLDVPEPVALKSDVKTQYDIEAIAKEDTFGDRIYYLEKAEDGEFKASTSAKVQVTLLSGDVDSQWEGDDSIPKGVHPGHLWYEDERGDCFILYCRIPHDKMLAMREALAEDPRTKITVSVYLLGFTREVDEFMRDVGQPRAIIVDGMTPAPVYSILINHPPRADLIGSVEIDDEEDEEADEEEDLPDATPDPQVTLASLLQSVSSSMKDSTQATKKMTLAIWVLAVLAGLNLLN